MASTVTDRQRSAYISGQAADARINIELQAEGMTLKIGPQHPATHGTRRSAVRLGGDLVRACSRCGALAGAGRSAAGGTRPQPRRCVRS